MSRRLANDSSEQRLGSRLIRQLQAQQAARLAVMLPNPRYYDKHRDTSYLNRRTSTILARMNAVDVP